MPLQHLRSSTAHKRPVPGNMSDGQLGINTNTGSPGLFFKDSNNALVKVGPVHVGTTAPNASPAAGGTAGNSVGEQWLDTTGGTYVFKVWDGSAWRSESGTFVDVNGDVMTGALGIIAGSASAPGLYFSGDTNTGIYSPGADQVAISTGGTGQVFVTSDGRLGLGVSSPTAFLAINGSNTTNSQNISFLASDTVNSTFRIGHTTGSACNLGANLGHTLRLGAFTDSGGQATAFSPYLTIDASGRVGIGSLTPSGKFDISDGSTTFQFDPVGGTGNILRSLTTAGARDSLLFDASQFVYRNSGSERFRCDSSGRLLFGTSTSVGDGSSQIQLVNSAPSLQVHRNANDAFQAGIVLSKARGNSNQVVQTGDTIGAVSFQGADGSNAYLITAAQIAVAVDGTPGANDMPGRLVFSTTADGASSPTTRMTIDSSGRVLIACTDALDFSSTTAAGNQISSTGFAASRSGAPSLALQRTTSDGAVAAFYRQTTQVGSISVTTTATAYNTSSDYRLKENIEPIEDAAARVLQLNPCRFNFIADPSRTVDGFIAHEAQAVVPEAITGVKDELDQDGNPIYQGIDQSKLVPLLTAALQDALGRISDLEARLAAAGI